MNGLNVFFDFGFSSSFFFDSFLFGFVIVMSAINVNLNWIPFKNHYTRKTSTLNKVNLRKGNSSLFLELKRMWNLNFLWNKGLNIILVFQISFSIQHILNSWRCFEKFFCVFWLIDWFRIVFLLFFEFKVIHNFENRRKALNFVFWFEQLMAFDCKHTKTPTCII